MSEVNKTFYIGQWIDGKDGRRYMNLIPLNAPADEAFNASVDFGKDIQEMVKKQIEVQQQAEKPVEEVTPEVVEPVKS